MFVLSLISASLLFVSKDWKFSEETSTTDSDISAEKPTCPTSQPKQKTWKDVYSQEVNLSALGFKGYNNLFYPYISVGKITGKGAGRYLIKLSGNWGLLKDNGRVYPYPWQGKIYGTDQTKYRPNPDKPFCSAILTNNGEDITPPPETEGFYVDSSTGVFNLAITFNALIEEKNLYSRTTHRMVVQKVKENPLKITIQKWE